MVVDLSGMRRGLSDARVRFVVIDAIAVAAPAYVRTRPCISTLCPTRATENLEDLCNVPVLAEARRAVDPARGNRPQARGRFTASDT